MTQPNHIKAKFHPQIHSLRGFAAISVLLFHWALAYESAFTKITSTSEPATLLFNALSFGWIGVLFFFALSGYLLGTKLLDTELNIKACKPFWLRRACRIYPAVWIQFGILITLILLGVKGFTAPDSILDGVLNFFLLINLPPILPQAINLVWWTLPIELSFYLLLPLLAATMKRTGAGLFLFITFILTIGWRAIIMLLNKDLPAYNSVHPILDLLPGTLFTFAAGMTLTKIPEAAKLTQTKMRVIGGLLLCGLCAWLESNIDKYWTGHWMLALWNPLASIPIALIVASCLGQDRKSYRISHWLGDISYGIYLWHFPVLIIVGTYTPQFTTTPSGSLASLLLTVIITLILAHASYHLIEKPVMKWAPKERTKA